MKYLLVFLLFYFQCKKTVQQRPLYNIAHMVNSIRQVNEFLELGANAIETDVVFYSNGTAMKTFHGTPCDCFRDCFHSESIVNYLEYTKNITTP
ncbi:sphingomyelin phosphodiesterase-like protein, partial [Leptotrombidium deliense]